MLYILYCTLSVLVCFYTRTAFSTPISYDQRQTGDVNVQIHLKDVQVVALLGSQLFEDYEDYDYAYDYADFTIKPISKPTTTSSDSTSTTIKPWTTWPTNPPKNITITTTDSSVTSNSVTTTKSTDTNEATESINDNSPEVNSTIYNLGNIHEINETGVGLQTVDKIPLIKKESNLEKQPISVYRATGDRREGNSKKICPTGYTMSTKGHCRAIRHRFSLMPLPELKLRSKLSNKNFAPLTKDLPIRLYKSAIRQ